MKSALDAICFVTSGNKKPRVMPGLIRSNKNARSSGSENGLRSLPKWPLKCRRESSAKNYEQEIHWSFQKKRQVS